MKIELHCEKFVDRATLAEFFELNPAFAKVPGFLKMSRADQVASKVVVLQGDWPLVVDAGKALALFLGEHHSNSAIVTSQEVP